MPPSTTITQVVAPLSRHCASPYAKVKPRVCHTHMLLTQTHTYTHREQMSALEARWSAIRKFLGRYWRSQSRSVSANRDALQSVHLSAAR